MEQERERPMSLKEVAEEITKNWEAKEAIEGLRVLIIERCDKIEERIGKLEGDTQPIIQARKEREIAFRYGKKIGTNAWNIGKWIGGITAAIIGTLAAFKAGFFEAVQEAMRHADKLPPAPPPGIGN